MPQTAPPPDYREVLASADGWVALLDDRLVEMVVALGRADHVLLEALVVSPAAQGRGVGVRLIAEVERHTVELGLREIRLCANQAMTENLAFYPRRGYRETSRGEQDGFHRVFFAKAVA